MKLTGLSFTWPDGPTIVEGLGLTLERGRITVLVGASGCGKSTLLRLIAGLLTPGTGTVSDTECSRAFVFQSPNLLPWLSVQDNVALTRKQMHREFLERRQAESATVLMVTHDLEEATVLCDRVVVLSGRPAAVVADVAITQPRPRNRHDPVLVAQVDALEVTAPRLTDRHSPKSVWH